MPSFFPSGPQLPAFSSMVVKGYHPSAPIHCALSQTSSSPDARSLVITPSRETISSALQNYNDDWISRHSGEGKVLELSSHITVFYPPTPAHFSFLLSMLSIDDQNPLSLNPTTTLDLPPSLIILHELSAYFCPDVEANPNGHSWTLSSYLTLVARTLASFAALTPPGSTTTPSLMLFDSQLDHLKLPVLKHPSVASRKPPSKLENVAFFVQKYFEIVAVFDDDADEFVVNSSQEEEIERVDSKQRRNRVKFFRQNQSQPFETRRWIEQVDVSGGTVFVWDV